MQYKITNIGFYQAFYGSTGAWHMLTSDCKILQLCYDGHIMQTKHIGDLCIVFWTNGDLQIIVAIVDMSTNCVTQIPRAPDYYLTSLCQLCTNYRSDEAYLVFLFLPPTQIRGYAFCMNKQTGLQLWSECQQFENYVVLQQRLYYVQRQGHKCTQVISDFRKCEPTKVDLQYLNLMIFRRGDAEQLVFKKTLINKKFQQLRCNDANKCVFLSETYVDGQGKTRRVYVVNLNNKKFYQIETRGVNLKFIPHTEDNVIVFKANGTWCFKDFGTDETVQMHKDQLKINNFDDLCQNCFSAEFATRNSLVGVCKTCNKVTKFENKMFVETLNQ